MKGLISLIKEDLYMAEDVISEGIRVCELPDGPKPYIETFSSDLELIRTLQVAADEGFDALYTALMT